MVHRLENHLPASQEEVAGARRIAEALPLREVEKLLNTCHTAVRGHKEESGVPRVMLRDYHFLDVVPLN